MPGVPSGRACEACRRQKKKCDERQPTCARCVRLNIPCVGSGQRRFKFQEGYVVPTKEFQHPDKVCHSHSQPRSRDENHTGAEVLGAPPTNAISMLQQAFVRAIHTSTDLNYNLAWAYGGFLRDIPSRLGTNHALDTAADAIISMHSAFCVGRKMSVRALGKYSRALNALRAYLDDPTKACSTDTLCAVMLLLICQGFMGNNNATSSGHAEGAAQILKARRYFGPRDEFEAKLLLSLRGPVLFEGLFTNRIGLSAEEWKALVENDLDGTSPEGQMMRCLARVPGIRDRAATMNAGDAAFESLRQEVRSLYETYQEVLTALQSRTMSVETPLATGPCYLLYTRLYAQYQRMYGLGLTVGIMLNVLLQTVDPDDPMLPLDSMYFAQEILLVAEQSVDFRPLGSHYVILCLLVAWAATPDALIRSTAAQMLDDYQRDFDGGQATEVAAAFVHQLHHIHALPRRCRTRDETEGDDVFQVLV
ncbi:hypothetical protein BDV25DRAFT_136641 [Aspergillus avenaceus]|uniref:Zn(2)-C6 fungal-type domain-containing protein n=1 Tax=Aspergillus avenaceus TaxID=36643 RepID=A0A5N6U554_ASPAV|nr:hypothetical protein BDV25DRAFT_136641 [Aspergillus avenaceus]